MHVVGTSPRQARRASGPEVVDLELSGAWVVDVRRHPRSADRAGWLVEWEDDIVFLGDSPDLAADEASEQVWPLDAA